MRFTATDGSSIVSESTPPLTRIGVLFVSRSWRFILPVGWERRAARPGSMAGRPVAILARPLPSGNIVNGCKGLARKAATRAYSQAYGTRPCRRYFSRPDMSGRDRPGALCEDTDFVTGRETKSACGAGPDAPFRIGRTHAANRLFRPKSRDRAAEVPRPTGYDASRNPRSRHSPTEDAFVPPEEGWRMN